ncbi:MAG: FAD-binding domain-containing protein, partial [Cyanobium sp. ELA507]
MPTLSPPWPADPADLPRELADRREVAQWLAPWFPGLAGEASPRRGGRREAERLLGEIDPQAYGASRNHLAGAVTGLSPYIRHGVLSLAEVRDAVLARVGPPSGSPEPEPAAGLPILAATRASTRERGGSHPFGAELPRRDGAPASATARPWHGAPRHPGEKLIQQLAWRDYWQRLWAQWGEGVHQGREPLKTGWPAEAYATTLPADLANARTGLVCIDAFAAELVGSGWLHNHARLWLASYVVHWRRLRWQVGARWFHAHLLDADGASNSLSWQWVASSFSSKPYIFNRANLERFAGPSYCQACPAAGRGGAGAAGGCPFEASYEELQERLFPGLPSVTEPGAGRGVASGAAGGKRPSAAVAPGDPSVPQALQARSGPAVLQLATLAQPAVSQPAASAQSAFPQPAEPQPAASQPAAPGPDHLRAPVLWIHAEALGPANAALRAHPHRPALFVFDPVAADQEPWGLKRLVFVYECLLELPVTIRAGDPVAELLAFVARCGADGVVTTRAVDPRLQAITAQLAARLPLIVLDPEPLVPSDLEPAGVGLASATKAIEPDLRRFSRYWRWAEPRIWGSPRSNGRD